MRKCYSCKLPWPDSHFEILDFPICGECKRDWPSLLNGMQRSRRKDICSICRGRARHEICICRDCTSAANVKAAPPTSNGEAPSAEAQIPNTEIWETQSMKLIENAMKQGMDVDKAQAIVVNKIGPNPLALDDEPYLRKLLSNKHIDQNRKAEIQALLKAPPSVEIQMPSPPAPGTIDWILSPPPPLPQSEIDKINRHSELAITGNGKAPMTSIATKPKRRF